MVKVWATIVEDIGTPENPYYKLWVPSDKHSKATQKAAIRAFLTANGLAERHWKRDEDGKPYVEVQPGKAIPSSMSI